MNVSGGRLSSGIGVRNGSRGDSNGRMTMLSTRSIPLAIAAKPNDAPLLLSIEAMHFRNSTNT
jgi:flagellar biosynthesis regulator FlaF